MAESDTASDRGLADDLLGSGESSPEADLPTATPVAVPDVAGDDEDYLQPARKRGKLTTGLIVALIFLLGILVGTVLSKTLSPAPAPQVVYVLNDAGSPAPTAVASTPR